MTDPWDDSICTYILYLREWDISMKDVGKYLVGVFNPFEKYWSKWESSPNRGEHKKYWKPPPRYIPYMDPKGYRLTRVLLDHSEAAKYRNHVFWTRNFPANGLT